MRVAVPALALTLSAVAMLAGCASSEPGPVEYGSVEDLLDAYLAAGGGPCNDWQQTNLVTLSAESGNCADGDAVLMTFTSEENRDAAVEGLHEYADMLGLHLLVGPNWIVNASDVRDVRGSLAGTLVMKEPTE
ncbi:hypothetical protein ACFFGH_10785 [Lysobacter korlensis]|uniref:Lipoprotein n=1 Tax=Lysobacter korlensis TaxID=553636 RepID=A0ABV6RMW8_9GAMM